MTRDDLRKRLDALEDDARAGDAPEPWMDDVPRELWSDPEATWRWCLRNDRHGLAGQAHFRVLAATYGHLHENDPAVTDGDAGVSA